MKILNIIIIIVPILILFFIIVKKKETFKSVSTDLNNNDSKLILEQLSRASFNILDNSKFIFKNNLEILNRRNIYEEFTIEEGKQSYTENKQRIFLCLRNRKNELYSFNSLLFVLLHEIAHVINNELHHTKKFKNIFKELLKHAENLGYYNSKIEFDANYCI